MMDWCKERDLTCIRVVKNVDRGHPRAFDMIQIFFRTEDQKHQFLEFAEEACCREQDFMLFTDEAVDRTSSRDTWAMFAAGFVRTFNRIWFKKVFANKNKRASQWTVYRTCDLHVDPAVLTKEDVDSLQFGLFRISEYADRYEVLTDIYDRLDLSFRNGPSKYHVIAVDRDAWRHIYANNNKFDDAIVLKGSDSTATPKEIMDFALSLSFGLPSLPLPYPTLALDDDERRPPLLYSSFYSASYMKSNTVCGLTQRDEDYKVRGGLIFVSCAGSHGEVVEYDILSAYANVIARFDLDTRRMITPDDPDAGSYRGIGGPGQQMFKDPRNTDDQGVSESLGKLMKEFVHLPLDAKKMTKLARNSVYGMTANKKIPYRCKAVTNFVTGYTREFIAALCKIFYANGVQVVCVRTDAVFITSKSSLLLDDPFIQCTVESAVDHADRVYLREEDSARRLSFRESNPVHVVRKNEFPIFLCGSKNNKSAAISKRNRLSAPKIEMCGYTEECPFDCSKERKNKTPFNVLENAVVFATLIGLPLVCKTKPSACETRVVWGDFEALAYLTLGGYEYVYFDPKREGWFPWKVTLFDPSSVTLEDGTVFSLVASESGVMINSDVVSPVVDPLLVSRERARVAVERFYCVARDLRETRFPLTLLEGARGGLAFEMFHDTAEEREKCILDVSSYLDNYISHLYDPLYCPHCGADFFSDADDVTSEPVFEEASDDGKWFWVPRRENDDQDEHKKKEGGVVKVCFNDNCRTEFIPLTYESRDGSSDCLRCDACNGPDYSNDRKGIPKDMERVHFFDLTESDLAFLKDNELLGKKFNRDNTPFATVVHARCAKRRTCDDLQRRLSLMGVDSLAAILPNANLVSCFLWNSTDLPIEERIKSISKEHARVNNTRTLPKFDDCNEYRQECIDGLSELLGRDVSRLENRKLSNTERRIDSAVRLFWCIREADELLAFPSLHFATDKLNASVTLPSVLRCMEYTERFPLCTQHCEKCSVCRNIALVMCRDCEAPVCEMCAISPCAFCNCSEFIPLGVQHILNLLCTENEPVCVDECSEDKGKKDGERFHSDEEDEDSCTTEKRERKGVKRKLGEMQIMRTKKLDAKVIKTMHPYTLYKYYDRRSELLILKETVAVPLEVNFIPSFLWQF